ncbi:MAG: dehydrogenase, partial [Verrucomicrobiales bacterium]|nr:dehydrogenase [Verrucomicrobiales bacterium]
PWGVDFDTKGNAFVTACVIDHMFHMAAGGHYVRQAGAPENPHGYGLLPSIVDHRHFRAAFCGVQVYNGHQYPSEYRGTIFQGNIHGNSVHQDKLNRHGASFKASHIQDFLSTDDGWFRPVSTQTGPDGCLWIMDWHDKYPCYQNARANPEGVNRTHGRIWRIVHGGEPLDPRPEKPLSKLSAAELVSTLGHPNSWHRRTAQRLLGDYADQAPAAALTKLLSSKNQNAAYHALLTLHESGTLTEQHLDTAAASPMENLRIWSARLTGERTSGTPASFVRLDGLAADRSPQVRLAVATALRQHTSSSLTVDHPIESSDAIPGIIGKLALASKDSVDQTLPFLIWMALEPLAAKDPTALLDWLASSGHQAAPLSHTLTYKLMLRICDSRKPGHLDAAAGFLAHTAGEHPGIATAALGGLLEGQKGRAVPPQHLPENLFAVLRKNLTGDQEKMQINRLGALWGDSTAVAGTIAVALDPAVGEATRIESLKIAAQFRTPDAREKVLTLVSPSSSPDIVTAALRTLRTIGDDSLGTKLLDRYPALTPALRREIANTLILRPAWANSLLSALEENSVATSEIPAPVIRALLDSGSEHIRARA